MTTVAFDFEWIESADSPDKGSQATMAELQVRVGDQPVTAVLDRRSRSYRERIIVPLLPLAEWIVANWWFLWHEPDAEAPHRRDGFSERHDLRYAGDGFLLPSVTIAPLGDGISVSSRAWRPEHGATEFLHTSIQTVDRPSLESGLRSIVDSVLDRLGSSEPATQELRLDWSTINDADSEEVAFCKAAALLGLDPLEAEEPEADTIIRLWDSVDHAVRDDLFACTNVYDVEGDAQWLRERLKYLEGTTSGAGWMKLRDGLGLPTGELPWERGYNLARRARAFIGLDGKPFDFDAKWTIDTEDFDRPHGRMEGLVAAGSPSCVVRARAVAGHRFLLARAVGEFLDISRKGPSVLSPLSTDRQAQSRAFAAEFLAPSAALSDALGPHAGFVDPNAVDELAQRFQVSTFLIRHQIQNHKLGQMDDWSSS